MNDLLSKYKNVIDENCFVQNTYDEKSTKKILQHMSDHLKKQKIFISLSGGVDSMVLLDIFSKQEGVEVYALHINYNNRDESKEEAEFLVEYCREKNATLIVHEMDFKRKDTDRNEYEETSRRMRYELYGKIIEEIGLDGVYLGHHDDDVVENIFNNVMKNNHLNDLSVLKPENIINGVKVFRPFVGHFKDVIYDYAFDNKVPYFKDTTPNWSCRGKMRNNIFPQLVDCYSDSYKNNLMNFSKNVNEMNCLLDILMENYMDFQELRCNTIMFTFNVDMHVLRMPVQFWVRIFNNVCDKVHISRFSKKAIQHFYDNRMNLSKSIVTMNKSTRLTSSCSRIFMEYNIGEKNNLK